MQAVQALSIPHPERLDSPAQPSIPVNWLTRLFGCRHKTMGSPFTMNNETYCTCMSCGARRHFSVERCELTGAYYYAPPSALYDSPAPKRFFNVASDGRRSVAPETARLGDK
ncbi:MAG TPA: hypothetical protein VFX96_17500 [Pyrinomonadaceae bacterium]|nr:hypothetical protein [Pyrinomonadaceae bacterium]